jgi:hypothetical protein
VEAQSLASPPLLRRPSSSPPPERPPVARATARKAMAGHHPLLFSVSLSPSPSYSFFHGDGDLTVVAAAGRPRPNPPWARPDLLPRPPDPAPVVLDVFGSSRFCGSYLQQRRWGLPSVCDPFVATSAGHASAAAPAAIGAKVGRFQRLHHRRAKGGGVLVASKWRDRRWLAWTVSSCAMVAWLATVK